MVRMLLGSIQTEIEIVYFVVSLDLLERPMRPKAFIAGTKHSFIHPTLMSMQS